MKITCDVAEANEAMHQRYLRFEALACHIGDGIHGGIKAHNTHEQGHGFLPATPDDISKSLAECVATYILKGDRTAVERFIEDLHCSLSEDAYERGDTL